MFFSFSRVESTLVSPKDTLPPKLNRLWWSQTSAHCSLEAPYARTGLGGGGLPAPTLFPIHQFHALVPPSLPCFLSAQYPQILGFWVSYFPFFLGLRIFLVFWPSKNCLLSCFCQLVSLRVCIFDWWWDQETSEQPTLTYRLPLWTTPDFGFSFSSPELGAFLLLELCYCYCFILY